MNDKELDDLIRQSVQPPDFPNSFQREVWQRIAISESRSWQSSLGKYFNEAFSWLGRPASAVATVVTMLIIGAGIGKLTTARETESSSRAAYAASINPILSAHEAFQK